MRYLRPVCLAVLALTLLFSACKKERQSKITKPGTATQPTEPDPENPTDPTDPKDSTKPKPPIVPNYTALEKIFEEQSVKYKTLTIDPSKTNSFRGNSGTRYVIEGNSLLKPDGTPVTGAVDVKVREYLDRGDMVFSKMIPESNGQTLESGGEIDIRVSQNGVPLRLRSSAPLRVTVPQDGTPATDMSLYIGANKTGDNLNRVNWNFTSPRQDSMGFISNTIVSSTGDSLTIISDSFNWINIDKLMKQYPPQSINIQVSIDNDTIPDSTAIPCYAFFDVIKAVRGVGIDVNTHDTRNTSLPTLPIHFAAFTIINGQFYGGILLATPANGKTYDLKLYKTDPVAFKKQLNQL